MAEADCYWYSLCCQGCEP